MKKSILILFSLGLFCSFQVKAQQLQKIFCDKKASTITYDMSHPLHSWSGVSHDVGSVILADATRDTIKQVAVAVKISSFDSGNANRDSHAMEVTDAIKYPTISFQSDEIKAEGKLLWVKGKLSFHGVQHEISFDATKVMEKGKAVVTGGFDIKMTDYKIDPPSLMGMATDDDIKIHFKAVY